MSSAPFTVMAWLATYALHSTLLLLAAWALHRGLRSARAREVLWRTALVGGLFSASVQLAFVGELGGPRWEVGSPVALERPQAEEADLAALPAARLNRLASTPRSPAGGPAPWATWALSGWSLGGIALLTWLLIRSRRLAAHLADRRELTTGPLPRALAELRVAAGVRRGVRLTVCPGLTAPVALGVLRPEICLPPRALDLRPGLARTLLAHELAHLARLDPLWLGCARLLETVFFFQPLNRVARRRLSTCAEFQCDAWAVRQTGDRFELARCLAEVAGWLVGEPSPSRERPVCAMADLRSPLGERVERILDERAAPERAPAWLAPMGAALLSATAMLAPGFAAPGLQTRGQTQGPSAGSGAEDALSTAWMRLSHQLDQLEAQLAELRAVGATGDLPDPVRERLDLALRRSAELRQQEQAIGSLLAAWQAATSQNPQPAR
jgi:bla regulator protein blaR1